MNKFNMSCPECKSPASPCLYGVACVSAKCPNYNERVADDFWGRFTESAEIIFDPWEEDTTLPGMR